ncbi:UDP-N-acetylmuramate--L-alanine ligase [Candidatus Beckwithbacteria bacterium]|nr:UDP-N-acetylmuramate--L-alanine ligase [Candidatus Beckwithbacteria bacterium]
MDLSKVKKIHFTGIKGVGMTALACIARDFGMQVSGSDTEECFVTDEILGKSQISITCGFSSEKIAEIQPDLLVYTVAHQGEENEEVIKAKELSIPVLSFAQALGLFFNTKKMGISVAGVGGKTTISAWLATVLEHLEQNPSYMIGVGKIKSLTCSGKYNLNGDIFITEADEYKSSLKDNHPKFFYQNPKIIVIPNLFFDHPDVYHNENETLQAFKQFVEKLPEDGALIINTENELPRKLLEMSQIKAKIFSYGQNYGEYRIIQPAFSDLVDSFKLTLNDKMIDETFVISVRGLFNIYNACAVLLTCRAMGIDFSQTVEALSEYMGLDRRLELVYKNDKTLLYDDYAHHPEEIKATLKTFKQIFPAKKLLVIFQPHTYSRTKALFSEFSRSFKDADEIILAPIFASAREKEDNSINSEMLALKIEDNGDKAFYCQNKEDVINYLKSKDLAETIILTMGAGDVYQYKDEIIKVIEKQIL